MYDAFCLWFDNFRHNHSYNLQLCWNYTTLMSCTLHKSWYAYIAHASTLQWSRVGDHLTPFLVKTIDSLKSHSALSYIHLDVIDFIHHFVVLDCRCFGYSRLAPPGWAPNLWDLYNDFHVFFYCSDQLLLWGGTWAGCRALLCLFVLKALGDKQNGSWKQRHGMPNRINRCTIFRCQAI